MEQITPNYPQTKSELREGLEGSGAPRGAARSPRGQQPAAFCRRPLCRPLHRASAVQLWAGQTAQAGAVNTSNQPAFPGPISSGSDLTT